MAKKSSTEKDIDKKDSENIKKNKSDNKSSEKKGFGDLQKFVKDSISELKKIQWPTRKQATAETIVVIITVVFMTSLVTVFDKLISWVLSYILIK